MHPEKSGCVRKTNPEGMKGEVHLLVDKCCSDTKQIKEILWTNTYFAFIVVQLVCPTVSYCINEGPNFQM